MRQTTAAALMLAAAAAVMSCNHEAPFVAVPTTGVVRSSTGDAVPQARVCAWPRHTARSGHGWTPVCTTADALGHYSLSLPVSTFNVIADAPGSIPARHRAYPAPSPPWLTVTEQAPPTGVDITLEPGATLHRGRVVDSLGDPVAEATVIAGWNDADRHGLQLTALTDDDGYYAVWAAEDVSTTVAARGYLLHEAIKQESSEGVVLTVIPGAEIRGVVVLPSGQPAVGVRVVSGGQIREYAAEAFATLTDRRGRFELRGLPPGEHHVVAHGPTAAGVSSKIQLELGETQSGVMVHLTRALVPLAIRIVDNKGAPVPHCRLDIHADSNDRLNWWRTADGYGRLELHRPPGTYVVGGINCPGFVGRPSYPPIELGADGLSEVRLEVSHGLTFRGKLVATQGPELHSRRVGMSSEEPSPAGEILRDGHVRVRPAADGTFDVHGLLPGRYWVSAGQSATHEDIVVNVDGSPERTTITLPPAGRLELLTPEHPEGAIVRVELCTPAREVPADYIPLADSATVRSGRAVFDDLAPGSYSWEHGDYGRCKPDAPTVKVHIGQTTIATPRLEVEHEASIHGVVRTADGRPRAGAIVELATALLRAPAGWARFQTRTVTDESGRFTLPPAQRADYVVRAWAPGLLGSGEVSTADGDASIDLTLR